MKLAFPISLAALALVLSNGCAIIKSANMPIARPPERLQTGMTQAQVTKQFGRPVAAGMEGEKYWEQIQFTDGVPMNVKVRHIVGIAILDDLTCFLGEMFSFPYMLNKIDDMPEYVYFVGYDDQNCVDAIRRAASREERAWRQNPDANGLLSASWAAPIFEKGDAKKRQRADVSIPASMRTPEAVSPSPFEQWKTSRRAKERQWRTQRKHTTVMN